jgi:hypothetical protein
MSTDRHVMLATAYEHLYDSGMVLDDLKSVVDQVCSTEPQALADGESIVELHRCLARLEAATTRATAAFDAGGEWAADGARSGAAWVAARCKLPSSSARRRVRLGRALRHLPAGEAAWLAGAVGEAQVAALARARTPATEEAMARDEEMLMGEAERLRFESFARVLAYWSHHADPDGVEADAERERDSRRVHLSQSFGRSWFPRRAAGPHLRSGGRQRLAPHRARAVRSRLGPGPGAPRRCRRRGRFGAQPRPAPGRRPGGDGPAGRGGARGGRRPEPLFTVVVGYETFAGRMCQLANGTVVSPGSLVPWLDEAWVERVVFDPASRVVDVGAARRAFTGATRRAVQLRDQQCFHPLCDEPAERCQVDHVEPWAAGGATVMANGRAACGHHNRARHRRP